MYESGPENSFNLEQFKGELAKKAEEYAEMAYITYGRNVNLEEVERQKQRAGELRQELLTYCAEMLSKAPNTEETMLIVSETLVDYKHGSGVLLFPEAGKTEFYRDLAMALAKKIKTTPRSAGWL